MAVVPLHADAVEIAHRQVALAGGIALVRRELIELCRPNRVPVHAAAILIAQAQTALTGGVILVRAALEQLHRPLLVLLHALAQLVAAAQRLHRPHVVLLGGLGEPVGRLNHVPFHAVAVGVFQSQIVLSGQVPQLRLVQQGLKLLPGLLQPGHRPLDQLCIDKDHLISIEKFRFIFILRAHEKHLSVLSYSTSESAFCQCGRIASVDRLVRLSFSASGPPDRIFPHIFL